MVRKGEHTTPKLKKGPISHLKIAMYAISDRT